MVRETPQVRILKHTSQPRLLSTALRARTRHDMGLSQQCVMPQPPVCVPSLQVVVDRMFRRILIFTGVPVFTGMALFPLFYYLRVSGPSPISNSRPPAPNCPRASRRGRACQAGRLSGHRARARMISRAGAPACVVSTCVRRLHPPALTTQVVLDIDYPLWIVYISQVRREVPGRHVPYAEAAAGWRRAAVWACSDDERWLFAYGRSSPLAAASSASPTEPCPRRGTPAGRAARWAGRRCRWGGELVSWPWGSVGILRRDRAVTWPAGRACA